MGTLVAADVIAYLLSLAARGGAKRFLQLASIALAVLICLGVIAQNHH